ncbi:hypothetical protein FNV43_RR15377 [Rhamnella rubrinervis]|uniref:AB hydrolase-1 domain-containing protein n=1 Tax=Rhamnella rubrinervis TaxID=2594499 RepID=A0A8K0GXE5_9ROSA|nr:hypothetical protein FNV43_RR15377 [Rhamnella rubrinervis]
MIYNPARNFVSGVTFIVFLILDYVDAILCVLYKFVDEYIEGREAIPCHCKKREEKKDGGEEECELSETLFGRKNVFREMGFLGFGRKLKGFHKRDGGKEVNRWSDCGCETCVSWMSDGERKLHVFVREPASQEATTGKPAENVIFIHGFLSSSSYWTEKVFPNLSEPVKRNYRLFAIDLLGFGGSPKPRDCLYTMEDHLEMIEKSVIHPYQLNSFHVVAHSMGCIVGMALAAKHLNSVKSITLVASPYFPSEDGGALRVLNIIAAKRLWPPSAFGTSVMSWYEHIGRCVCLLICRNHRTWERILRLLTGKSDLHFLIMDLTKHTHHSAWHSMHNVICGGVKSMEGYLEAVTGAGVKICVLQGERDLVVPVECSYNIKQKAPNAEVDIIKIANHRTVIISREKQFTSYLERIWASLADSTTCTEEY